LHDGQFLPNVVTEPMQRWQGTFPLAARPVSSTNDGDHDSPIRLHGMSNGSRAKDLSFPAPPKQRCRSLASPGRSASGLFDITELI
jgi:hypothetical protein